MKKECLRLLAAENPKARRVDLEMFADALLSYREADRNIKTNGAVCLHPRTAAPIDNPYLKVRATQGATLARLRAVRGDTAIAYLDTLDAAEDR